LGYAIGDVGSEAIEDALVKKQTIYSGQMCKPSIGTTEEDMYKVTLDFTNIDYLICQCHAQGSGATTGTVKVKIAGVTKATFTTGVDEDYANDIALIEIDCTAITGSNVLSVTGDNDNVAGYTSANPIIIYARES